MLRVINKFMMELAVSASVWLLVMLLAIDWVGLATDPRSLVLRRPDPLYSTEPPRCMTVAVAFFYSLKSDDDRKHWWATDTFIAASSRALSL